MRKLVLITRSLYMRDFMTAGAFDAIDDDETYYVTGSSNVKSYLAGHPRYLGALDIDQSRKDAYAQIRDLMLTHYRFRSRTARVKLRQQPWRARTLLKLRALPGLRHLRIRRLLRGAGLDPEMHRLMRELKPDLLIAPAAGIDGQVFDAIRSAKELGIPSLALMYNWDNLSSKAAFAVEPDYIGVGGFQGAEHAETIHRIPRERTGVLGSPYIDTYFRHAAGSTESPFPFPYVLFAGCYQPFDERGALQRLDAEIERRGLDLKVVYLPHPRRLRRDNDDFVDESTLEHVVVEPSQREAYVTGYEKWRADPSLQKMGMPRLPLDQYPALLENAEFVVCPLSTMMLEAAILRRRVLVIAFHDGIHATSPGVAIDYLHFEGVERVETFEVCRELEEFGPLFGRMAAEDAPAAQPPKEQMDYWVYHDERTFGERLAAFVERIGAERGLAEREPDRIGDGAVLGQVDEEPAPLPAGEVGRR
jgi:hypothetical protein